MNAGLLRGQHLVTPAPVWFAPRPSGDKTGATDTAAIQKLIDAGGWVQLGYAPTSAPYYVTQLALRTGTTLSGAGRLGTVLRAPLGQASGQHMVVLADATVNGWVVADLALDGQNGMGQVYGGGWTGQANQFDGIHLTNAGTGGPAGNNHFFPWGQDMTGEVRNVTVVQMSGHGIYVGNNCSETRFFNVYSLSNFYTGFEIEGFDLVFENCTAGANGSVGFYDGAGRSLSAVNCRAWWNGGRGAYNFQTNNFYFASSVGGVWTGIYSQDSYSYGLTFQDTASRYRVTGRISGAGAAKAEVEMFNCNDNVVDLVVTNDINNVAAGTILTFDGTTAARNRVRINGSPSGTPTWFSGNAKGNEVFLRNQAGSQSIAYAATITPSVYAGQMAFVGTLTGNITVNNPSDGHGGATLTFQLVQDATGGRTVTWGANYKTTGAITTTASSVTTITFVYDGTNWREVTRAVT